MAAERVLSVEIGYSLTKACEIENPGKNPKICKTFLIRTPQGMIRDGIVDINEEFVNLFLRRMSQHHIKTRKAIFTVTSNRIATREAVIPYVKDKQIIPVVRANLSEYFPVDLSQYMFSHSVLEVITEEEKTDNKTEQADAKPSASPQTIEDTNKSKKGGKSEPKGKPTGLKLLLLAAPKQLIASYEKLAAACSLDLQTIDYNGNSIYQAAKEECSEGVQMIIKVDERSTLLMVLEDGVISLNRTITYGIEEAVTTLKQCKELGDTETYLKSLEIARRKTVILPSFDFDTVPIDLDNESVDAKIREEKQEVTEALHPLVSGIIRVIDFYNSNHSQRQIEKIYVTGVGADFSGLSTLLSRESGLKIKNLVHLAGIDIEKIFKDVSYGEYVPIIGASIAPLKFYPDHVEEKGSKGTSNIFGDVDTLVVALAVLGVGVVASIAMVVATLLPYLKEKKLKEGYESTIAAYQPDYDIYLEYLGKQSELEYLDLIEKETRNRNEEMIDFISALEKKMPSSFCINTLEADEELITIDATVSSKEEVAYIVDTLKESPSFAEVEITGVTFQENDLGEYEYEFTLELYYAPYEDEEADSEEVEEVV